MEKIIQVRVVAKASKNAVIKFGGALKAYITAPPQNGKANKALVGLLAKHLNLKKSQLSIIKGEKSKDKLIKINY